MASYTPRPMTSGLTHKQYNSPILSNLFTDRLWLAIVQTDAADELTVFSSHPGEIAR